MISAGTGFYLSNPVPTDTNQSKGTVVKFVVDPENEYS